MKDISFVTILFGPTQFPAVSIATLVQAPDSASVAELRAQVQEMAKANIQSLGWTPEQVKETRIIGPMSRSAAKAIFDASPGTPFTASEYVDMASRLGGTGIKINFPFSPPRSGKVS